MNTFTTRPVYMGRHGVVASGHYLGARAGQRMFDKGGNAVDAAVASGFALNVLEPQSCGIGGEVPILVYSARDRKVHGISGQGCAGSSATIPWFRQAGIDPIPGDGFLPATVPAAFGTWATALAHFGTLSLADVLEPAIDYTESGFPMYPGLHAATDEVADRFRAEWPTSAAVYLPGGRIPAVGELFKNPDWARTMKQVLAVEKKARRRGRRRAIQAAIDYWYQGAIAERIALFMQKNAFLDASGKKNHGLLTREDFASWQPRLESPLRVRYRGLDVFKCGPWTQGPVFLQQLLLLEGYDLAKLGHNSTDYIHTVIEAAKLAFADRERYYGDPDFTRVPLQELLSKAYTQKRRELIDAEMASLELRPGSVKLAGARERSLRNTSGALSAAHRGDTTHTCAIDIHGNMMAATCSGGWIPSSPVVPGLGFPMGTRAQMFNLDPAHPNCLAPGKRPRTTLTPSLVLKNGRPWMVFGTPGGDQQDQWTLQFFLNVVDFGMNLQEAIDRPTFHTVHFPSSFYPHEYQLGGLVVEDRIPDATRQELAARGHLVASTDGWSNGKVMAVRLDASNGVISGAVSPRGQIGYVSGA
jgi:gamma-glutamyltranspeptidase/glutathione hydrolase